MLCSGGDPPRRDKNLLSCVLSAGKRALLLCGAGLGMRCHAGRENQRAEAAACLARCRSSSRLGAGKEHRSPQRPCSLRGSSRQPALRAAPGIHQQSSLVAEMRMRSFCQPLHSDGGLLQALLALCSALQAHFPALGCGPWHSQT